MSRTTAELIVKCLENEGVTHIFGLPGEENIYLLDALSRSGIRFILVRHEQGASFMADVYGRLTGKAGVCLSPLGPGSINLLLGVADAHTNSTSRPEPDIQGIPPDYQTSGHICPGYEMGRHAVYRGRRSRNGTQGIPVIPDRTSRLDISGHSTKFRN